MNMQNKRNKLEQYFYAILITVFPLFHVTKGIDFTDSGYSIMLFQNMDRRFNDWMLSTYLANRVGSYLMKLPGGNSYIGIKIYCLLLLGGMALGLYVFLSRFFHYRYVAAGMVIALSIRWCPGVVLYNYLSYFFFYGAVILIVSGCIRNQKIYLYVAGVLLGINIFTRLPNITQIILIVPVVFWSLVNRERISSVIGTIAVCILGFITGLGGLGGWILVRYGKENYLHMLQMLTDLSKEQEGYSGVQMLTSVWLTIWSYHRWLLGLFVLLLIFSVMERFVLHKRWMKIGSAFLEVAVGLVLLRYAHYWGVFTMHDYTSYHAITFFAALLVISSVILSVSSFFSKNMKNEIRMLALVNLCIILIAPLGTNTGFQAITNNLYFIAPFTLGMAGVLFAAVKKEDSICARVFFGMLLAFTFVQSLLYYNSFVYGDMKAKELTKRIEGDGVMGGIWVLEGMEPILSGVTGYVNENDLKGKECITFGNIPLMAFALEMPTAISTSWPDLNSYPIDEFERELNLYKNQKPVLVLNKWYFFGKDVFDEEIQRDLPKTKVLADYLIENGYEKTYENDKFQIFECNF